MKIRSQISALVALLLSGKAVAQGTLYEVEINGTRAQRINLVFLSEGYHAASLPNFAAHVNTVKELLFTREPWKQYRSYCNVYRIEVASVDNGTDNGATPGAALKNTYFSSGFTTVGIDQLCTLATAGQDKVYSLLNSLLPEYDVPIVIVNDSKYGGSGGAISVATVDPSSGYIVEHEVGHSLVDLADEYDYNYPGYTPQEKINNTAQTNRALIKWNYWIDAATPVPTPESYSNPDYYDSVGLFEGSMYRTSGWYRPHLASLMQYLQAPCGQVNREAFVLKYYSLISPLDSFSPANTARVVTVSENLSFNVTPKIPSSGIALSQVWKIDGIEQAGETGAVYRVASDGLGNGVHSVSVTTKDPTPFVRKDTASKLQQTVTWPFTLTNQLPNTLLQWRLVYGPDLQENAKDGMANLVKYGLGLNPNSAATASQFPIASRIQSGSTQYLALSVPRRLRRGDVDYIVESSGDLVHWTGGVTIQDTTTNLVVRDTVEMNASVKRFIRLKIRTK